MQNLINLMFPNSPQAMSEINNFINTAEKADFLLEAYQSFQKGELNEFCNKLYNTNIKFRIFYDKNKDKTLEEIIQSFDINIS